MAGWQDAPVVSSAAPAWASAPVVGSSSLSSTPSPSLLDSMLRQIALGGRNVGEAVFDTFAAPHDLGIGLQNLMRAGANRVLGTNLKPQPTFAGNLSNALTQSGAPVPKTTGEQYASAIERGVAGALTGGGALGAVSPALSTPANLTRAGIAGVTGATASEATKQAGGGPGLQLVAGVLGGLSPGAIEGITREGASLAGRAVRPLTRSGQEQMAANLVSRQATNPQAAAANLATAQDIVPGSARTAGEASGDAGLLALEKGIRARFPGLFGQRISEQNAARQSELTALGGTPADIAAAESARDAETAPMRDAAFAQARQLRAMNAPADALDVQGPPVIAKRNYTTPDPTQDSLLQFMAKHSQGLNSAEAVSQGIDPSDFLLGNLGIRRAFRKGGVSFDQAAETLHQAGYQVADEAGNYSPNVLLDAIDGELRGQPVYSVSNTRRFAELDNGLGNPYGDPVPAGSAPTITTPVHQTISQILASPQGARESIGKTMRWAQGLIGDHTDPETLYEVRKDLSLAQQGRLQPNAPDAPNASMLAQARSQLGKVVESLDNSIESEAPGFKAYLARYKELSQPIDQKRTIQDIQNRATLSSMDITTGHSFLGSAQFDRALDTAIENPGMKLSPEQLQRLEAVRTDLKYGAALHSPLIKAPGSDTYQNLSLAQVLGAGATDPHPALRLLARPLSWVYRAAGSDDRVNDILARAMLDPKMAHALLQRATPASVTTLSSRLRAVLGPYGIGAAAAAGTRSMRQSSQ